MSVPDDVAAPSRPGRAIPAAWLRRTIAVLSVVALCAVAAVVTARATSSFGPHTATYEVTVDGAIIIDLGPLGTIDMVSPVPFGLGTRATVHEIPDDLAVVNPDSTLDALGGDLQAYLQFFSSPQATIDNVAWALTRNAIWRFVWYLAAVTILSAGVAALLGRARRNVILAGLAPHTMTIGAGLAIVLVVAVVVNPQTAARAVKEQPPSAVFDGTALAGTRITGRLSGVIETYGVQLLDLYDSNERYYADVVANTADAWQHRADLEARTAELAATGLGLSRLIPTIAPTGEPGQTSEAGGVQETPGSDSTGGTTIGATDGATGGSDVEPDGAPSAPIDDGADLVTFLQVSDLHCNVGMAPVITRVAELAGAAAILDTGDTTMNGTAVEQFCVTAFAHAAPRDVPWVISTGNHDSSETGAQARSAGMIVLDGKTVDVAGVKILGDSDPNETRPGRGTTTAGEETVADAAARLAEQACASEPDLLMVHSPRVGTPALESGCVPAQISGHVHRRIGPQRVGLGMRYVNGTTAGASEGQLTIGPLRATAQMTILRFNRTTRTMLDFRVVSIEPDSSVSVGAPVRFGTVVPDAADIVDEAAEPAAGS